MNKFHMTCGQACKIPDLVPIRHQTAFRATEIHCICRVVTSKSPCRSMFSTMFTCERGAKHQICSVCWTCKLQSHYECSVWTPSRCATCAVLSWHWWFETAFVDVLWSSTQKTLQKPRVANHLGSSSAQPRLNLGSTPAQPWLNLAGNQKNTQIRIAQS